MKSKAKSDSTTATKLVWSLPDVIEATNLSRANIYNMLSAGEFPPARRISAGRIAWLPQEISSWIESRPVSTEPVRKSPRRAKLRN